MAALARTWDEYGPESMPESGSSFRNNVSSSYNDAVSRSAPEASGPRCTALKRGAGNR